MKNVMLDLETLDTKPTAAILAIGAVEFDLENFKLGDRFYQVIDLESCFSFKRLTTSASTIKWWMEQPQEARSIFNPVFNAVGIGTVLSLFKNWFSTRGTDIKLWGNGAAFDNVILRNAYDVCGISCPWSYKNDRCYRTIHKLFPNEPYPEPTLKHNALSDAIAQAETLLTIMRRISMHAGQVAQ